jgi:hypothetical protein
LSVENNLAYQINGNGAWAQTNLIGHWYTGSQDAISIQVPGAGANSAQMVMLGNGNVGIGTVSPAAALHVVDAASNFAPSLTYESPAAFIFNNGNQDLAIATSNAAPWATWLQVRNAANAANPLSLNPLGGNVGIGTTAPGATLEVNGSVKLTSNSGASITFQDGTTQSTAYTGVTCGGDYAESVDVTGNRTNYEPGDLLVLDANNPGKILKSLEAYSTLVSGIYSTRPGTVGRRQATPKSSDEVPMAVVGIVPARVSVENGPVKIGDLLVTSSTPGYAMKGTDRARMLGSIVGKAMANMDSGKGLIEVLVTLQ